MRSPERPLCFLSAALVRLHARNCRRVSVGATPFRAANKPHMAGRPATLKNENTFGELHRKINKLQSVFRTTQIEANRFIRVHRRLKSGKRGRANPSPPVRPGGRTYLAAEVCGYRRSGGA